MTIGEAPDPALEQATEWLMQAQAAPDDTVLRQRIEAWLAVHPDHVRAWEQARRAWQALGAAKPVVLSYGQARKRHPNRPRLLLAVSALAACLALLFLPELSLRWRADFRSSIGEIRTILLEDGSQVQLAPQSAVRARFQDGKRQVELLQGQAFFQVVRDPAHPFSVAAGPVTATVLGTAFDVRLAKDGVAVSVESGRVAVTDSASGRPLADPLTAGTRIVARPDKAAVVEPVPASTIADWRSGQLFFAHTPVAEVVEAISAYHSGWIVVADPDLAATLVTGLYDPRDKDRALRALVRPAKGRVTSLGPLTVLSAH